MKKKMKKINVYEFIWVLLKIMEKKIYNEKRKKKMVLELKWATAQTVLQYSLWYCNRGRLAGNKLYRNTLPCIVTGKDMGRVVLQYSHYTSDTARRLDARGTQARRAGHA